MNKTQRLILAMIVPFVVLTIAGKIAYEVGQTAWVRPFLTVVFAIEKVWWVWVIAFAFIGVFEYFLFRDRKKD